MEELNRYPIGSMYPITRKGKNGETIPNGYAISFYYEDLEGEKKRKTCTGKSEEELVPLRTTFITNLFYEKLALRQQQQSIALLKQVLPSNLINQNVKCHRKVNVVVDDYLKWYKQRVKYKTYENEQYAAKHVKTWLGDKMVCDLKGIDYQYLLNEVAKGKNGKRASKKTVNNVKGCYGRVIRFCKSNGWITLEDMNNLLEHVSMPVTARKEKNAKYLPMDEMGAILNGLKIKMTGNMFLVTPRTKNQRDMSQLSRRYLTVFMSWKKCRSKRGGVKKHVRMATAIWQSLTGMGRLWIKRLLTEIWGCIW